MPALHLRQTFFRLSLALGLIFSSGAALAAKLDLEMHNQLIEKLSSVVSASEDKDEMVDRSAVTLRLADLHSERSRMLSVANGGKGSEEFKAQIADDRRKALALYKKAYKRLNEEQKARIDLQSAHLHLQLKEEKLAEGFFKKLAQTRGSAGAVYRAQAFIQLGDMAFAKGDFLLAKNYFEKALSISENPRRAYSESRLAWCFFNSGQTQIAEKKLIQLLRSLAQSEDKAFQEEVSKDLATFMAKNDVNTDKIQTLKSLSPANVLQPNLIHLATELDRISKKQSALLVWSHVDKKAITYMDQVEKQINIARIQYDLGHKGQLVIEIKRAAILLADDQCQKEAECDIEKQRLRTILTDWGKAEERIPSKQLVEAYVEYLKYFEDYELAYWAGQTALKQKQFANAFKMFKLASSYKSLHKKLEQKNVDPRDLRLFEGALLSAIDAAESTKDKNMQMEAYLHYLHFNPEGEKSWEVRYQIAMIHYDLNRFQESSPRFKEIALSKTAAQDLRNKSADLYFDALALEKNDAKIEAESLVFAAAMPQKKDQFQALWRKAILNQTAQVLKNQAASERELTQQYEKINAVSLAGWPPDERKKLAKNKLLLAYRVNDLIAVEKSVLGFLAQKGLSKDEKNEAYLALAWSQEMRLEFAAALSTLKSVQPKNELDHTFKLALLSELSQKDPSPYYRRVLALTRSGMQAQFAAHQLVVTSSSPSSAYEKYFSLLEKNRQLFASATIYVYERNPRSAAAQRAMKKSAMQMTAEGSLIQTATKISEIQSLRNAAQTPLRGSDAQVGSALKKRLQAIAGIERSVTQGIRQKNLTLQFLGLTQLADLKDRLAADILKLPTPRGLKPQEKAQYLQQVSMQTAPYVQQAQATKDKALELWSTHMEETYLKELIDWSEQKRRPGSNLARQELLILKGASQKLGLSQSSFIKFTEQRRQLSAEAHQLHQRLRQDPFNISHLQELQEVQRELGSGPMVAYLNTRLKDLKSLERQRKGERN